MVRSDSLLASARSESIKLLRANLSADGVMAAAPTEAAEARNYTRIFGRDHAICSLAMMGAGDAGLLEGAKAGLRALAVHQAPNGQIPKYVDPQRADSDFWYLGCIDATLWWLIALRLLERDHPGEALTAELGPAMERALWWLQCQEHPRLKLLQQNEASDWADIMPRSGFVLYTNALWYYVKRQFDLPGAQESWFHFNHLFYPFSQDRPDYRRLRLLAHYVRRKSPADDLYLSFVNFSYWGEEGDVFGNLLAVLLGLATDAPANRIVRELQAEEVDRPYPVRAVSRPIRPSSRLWRAYMGRHRQNLAYQYHNGGCWPFIGGFWVMVLAQMRRDREAAQALEALARSNAQGNWEFNEWFHGKSGEPGGMKGQSWNAAMWLLAERALAGERLFRLPP